MNKTKFGNYGEDLAVQYLQKLGYKIIERNFRIRGGEIDIVAQYGQTLVYIEVKTRTSHRFGLPEESITYRKIKHLEHTAKFYRANRKHLNLPDLERIDVVTVDSTDGEPKISLFKNAGF